MLQQKDQQIEELTRKLMQKQQLVEMLRQQLEMGMNGGLPQSTGHVKIKQEPPDSCSSPPPITTGMCAIKQEVIKEEELESETSPGLPQSTQKERVCRFFQQKIENPLQPQERDHQSTMEKGGPMLEDLQNHSKQPTQTHLGQQQRQDAPQQTPQVRSGAERSIRDEPGEPSATGPHLKPILLFYRCTKYVPTHWKFCPPQPLSPATRTS